VPHVRNPGTWNVLALCVSERGASRELLRAYCEITIWDVLFMWIAAWPHIAIGKA
jgi:hypothetical protein